MLFWNDSLLRYTPYYDQTHICKTTTNDVIDGMELLLVFLLFLTFGYERASTAFTRWRFCIASR